MNYKRGKYHNPQNKYINIGILMGIKAFNIQSYTYKWALESKIKPTPDSVSCLSSTLKICTRVYNITFEVIINKTTLTDIGI